METGDHPEVDDSDLLPPDDIAIYQMLIGSAQWAVTLGRVDIQYATNTLARFASQPREGHLKRALRLFGYLKHQPKAKIYFDAGDSDRYGFAPANEALHEALEKREIEHTWELVKGGEHAWGSGSTQKQLPKSLEFVGKSFLDAQPKTKRPMHKRKAAEDAASDKK